MRMAVSYESDLDFEFAYADLKLLYSSDVVLNSFSKKPAFCLVKEAEIVRSLAAYLADKLAVNF